MRVVLYVVASVTESGNPQVTLLLTIILTGSLLFLKGIIGLRLYRSSFVDILETVTIMNLLTFATFSLCKFKSDNRKQTAVGYVSTILTFLILVVIIIYHVAKLLLKKKRTAAEHNPVHTLTSPIAQCHRNVTHSTIEIS